MWLGRVVTSHCLARMTGFITREEETVLWLLLQHANAQDSFWRAQYCHRAADLEAGWGTQTCRRLRTPAFAC